MERRERDVGETVAGIGAGRRTEEEEEGDEEEEDEDDEAGVRGENISSICVGVTDSGKISLSQITLP